MAITLGAVVLDADWTAVREGIEEVGGRDAREVVLHGLVVGLADVDAIAARLDEIVDAASEEDYSAELSVRMGRVLFVRRKAFSREADRENQLGSFALTLEARDPYEWSAGETVAPWAIDADPSELGVSTSGTVDALPVITLTPAADVTRPAVGDGARTLTYDGVVAAGQVLVFDAVQSRVTLDGADVTPYAVGDFPRIEPGGATLAYSDDDVEMPVVAGEVRFRDRWW